MYNSKTMIYATFCPSPFGCFEIKGSDQGIRSVKMVNKTPCIQLNEVPELLENCVQQLAEYFDQKRTSFDLKLDFEGHAEFSKSVWYELLKIPYGRTTTYSAIAEQLANPTAMRAVGLANRNNPIAIIVPCHRVIAKNGDLQGYFYGLDMKRSLLAHENPMSYAPQGSLF